MAQDTFDFSRLRIPLGSLAVDATLVVALIWWGAQMTSHLGEMDRRLAAVEKQSIQPEADKRLALLEAEAISARMWRERMERKLDDVLDQRRK